ncbi:MAG: MBL fold metallo-hydrolase [Methanosarcinaceae archaeon]|nr:MBL fold metallo-hydrolase [Methanosarcinaceae archaeon]MDF1534515.1 MBL fold metallo-hydrolase [Methanosarcinaceae archaeon]
MKITFLGTGVAIPQPERVQSGMIIEIDSKPILFDCGGGVLNRIFESSYNHTDIDTIVLSHLHLDHVADVLCLIKANWLCDRTDVTIYGLKGTQQWISSLLGIYDYMQGKVNINVTEVAAGEVFTPDGVNCSITCASGVHSVPSLGYRIESGGATVVYSGDTEPCNPIMGLCSYVDVDVLVHECSFPIGFEVTNHTTPDMLAGYIGEHCREINIDRLYLTHLYPHMQGHERESVKLLQQYFKGGARLASDLLEIEV